MPKMKSVIKGSLTKARSSTKLDFAPDRMHDYTRILYPERRTESKAKRLWSLSKQKLGRSKKGLHEEDLKCESFMFLLRYHYV